MINKLTLTALIALDFILLALIVLLLLDGDIFGSFITLAGLTFSCLITAAEAAGV